LLVVEREQLGDVEPEARAVLLQVAFDENRHADLLEAVLLERVQLFRFDAQLRRELLDGEILGQPCRAQPLAQGRRRRGSLRLARLLAVDHRAFRCC
jgi:hypothetical protein